MNLQEATQKIIDMSVMHSGKVGNKINIQLTDGTIHLDDIQKPTLVSNDTVEAPCTIMISNENLARLFAGDLNPMMAFMTGGIKILGDKSVAMKLVSLF